MLSRLSLTLAAAVLLLGAAGCGDDASDAAPLAAVTDVQVDLAGSSATVTWTPHPAAETYRVDLTSDIEAARTQTVAAPASEVTFADLTPGLTYQAQVTALRGTEAAASPRVPFHVPDPRAERIAEITATMGQSLHGTAKGMEYWYGRPDGFGGHAGVEYAGLGCGGCHVFNAALTGVPAEQPCLACHAASASDPSVPDYATVVDSKCLTCHSRQGSEIAMNLPDVHRAAGMRCPDCHTEAQIHGGQSANTMFDVVNVSCRSCHKSGGSAPQVPSTPSHITHRDDLACQSCHMSGSVTCYNCHFEDEVTQNKKTAYRKFADWLFLGNYRGGVYPLNFQSVQYQGKTFNAWGPFHGHTITEQGRACSACHANANLLAALDTGLAVTSWDHRAGTLNHATGVIPVVPDYQTAFRFDYVTRDASGTWIFAETGPDFTQMMYSTPLTSAQIFRLRQPH